MIRAKSGKTFKDLKKKETTYLVSFLIYGFLIS